MKIENLDQWQRDFINYDGDKVLVSGRQTGKSEAQAYDNAEFLIRNQGKTALIVSKTERQSEELLIKILNYLQENYPDRIGKGKYKPLKQVVYVMHGKHKKPSRAICQPVGLAGEGIRGYTIDKLSVDEAQLPLDAVYDAITPMLLTTGGKISLTGTPQGKKGYFWRAYENKTQHWKVFHVNSEQVINERPISDTWREWQKAAGLDFLRREKERMSEKRYRQEYLGEFVEDLDQVFSDNLILKTCTLKRRDYFQDFGEYYIGVDVGRTDDPSTFEIVDARKETIEHVESIVRRELKITETADKILELHKQFRFKLMGIDGGGMGAGVVDILMKEPGVKYKVRDLNNAKRTIKTMSSMINNQPDKQETTTLLKEDMYRHLLNLMERGKVRLLDDQEVINSLKSCQIEYVDAGQEVRIYGSDTHIVEGIIRALWTTKEKALNIWAY